MGANATGKTSFGQMLMSVFNFIHKKETAYLINRICDVKKEANFSIDFVMNRFTLYSMQIIIHPVNDDDYTENNIEVKIDKIKINKNDSYESCKKRMESKNNLSEYTANYVEELDKLSRLSWLFVSPEKEEKFNFSKTVSADCILFLIVSMLLSDEFLGYSQKYEVPQQLLYISYFP